MANAQEALSDIKVLDLSQGVAGPFCAKLLGGLGAEVIKVEPPGAGDVSRSMGPFLTGGEGRRESAFFLYLNTAKKGVTLDLDVPLGRAAVRNLAQDCDVVIESFPPGYMKNLDLDYSSLESLNPGLVYASVTPFGQWGPYAGYMGSDLVAQAVGALMCTVGMPDQEPLKIGRATALYTTGMSAFSATMLALYARDISGVGQQVDVSDMETIAVAQIHSSIHFQFGRTPARRESNLVPAKDGWVSPGLETGAPEGTWPRVCELMGTPELAEDERFATPEARRENQQELREVVGRWAAGLPKEEIYHTLQGMRTITGYVATVEDLVNSRQMKDRDFFQGIDFPGLPEALYPGHPVRIDGELQTQVRAPLLGEHNGEIFAERLGYSREQVEEMTRQSGDRR